MTFPARIGFFIKTAGAAVAVLFALLTLGAATSEKKEHKRRYVLIFAAFMALGFGLLIAGGNAPNAVMMGHVRRIVWCPSAADALDDLWPISLPERYAGLTKTPVKADEIAGTWEHINLKYDYGKQDTAANLTLNADGKMSGVLSGTWSFDEAKQFLTLTAGGKSKETVVYAGTEKSLNATWWGKKVQ